jgi:hypothetical protein
VVKDKRRAEARVREAGGGLQAQTCRATRTRIGDGFITK